MTTPGRRPAFRIHAEGVDGEALAEELRRAIEAKKEAGALTDDEVREIAGRRLHPVLEPHDLKSTLLAEVLERPSRWNYGFAPDAIYRSARGGLLERVRALLRPVQKLFWNPTPMISALSRQSEINEAQAQLVHNLVLEVTRLNLELRDLKGRVLQLQAQLEQAARRSKALEALVAPGADEPGGA